MCSEEFSINEVDSLEADLHRVAALLERDFPVSLHVIVFHLLHHLPTYLRNIGPVYGFWMYISTRTIQFMDYQTSNEPNIS